ncbi:MAG: DUF4296 domain-containing protein [Flavobacteriales bacterium]|nr:DUF4296 domain-containing protein [Flavobacteriales bacterium]NNK80461.1 DUF4296 domain-containing protein [Flavobacteriales bacterium]
MLIILLIFISSCQVEEEIIPPKDLIPEDEFVEILVDLNLIESIRSMHMTKEKETKVETEVFYNELWERTDVSAEQFKTSFEFYRKDVEKMAEFYDRASQSIKRKEDLLNEQKRQSTIDQDDSDE